MAHWHDFNPWASRLRYISYDQMREVLDPVYSDERLAAYGKKLDAYIIALPSGAGYSFGIRYGAEPSDYLSPQLAKEQGDAIMLSFNEVN